MDKLSLIKDIKEAQQRVKAVNDCPTCLEHLNAIKEHTAKGHKD